MSSYNNCTQVHAGIEFACLDIIGQKLGIPVSEFLGVRLRDEVEFASYLFFRYPGVEQPDREERTAEQLVAYALELAAGQGFRSHKLKGGVYPPRLRAGVRRLAGYDCASSGGAVSAGDTRLALALARPPGPVRLNRRTARPPAWPLV